MTVTWRELEAEIEDWARRQDWACTSNDFDLAPFGWETALAQHLEAWLNERRAAEGRKADQA